MIVTEIYKGVGRTKDQYDKYIEHKREVLPMRRVGDAEEVAQAIAFLASSSSASFITGEHLHIDGGEHAACLTT